MCVCVNNERKKCVHKDRDTAALLQYGTGHQDMSGTHFKHFMLSNLPLEKIPEQSHAGQPCYLSAFTDKATELTLPDGLYAGFVALMPTACRLWDIL